MKTYIPRSILPEHIFFHADFDGAVSAAMVLRWARPIRPIELHPVDYYLKTRWDTQRLPPNSVVVDFLFHPDALVWVDHHSNPFVRTEWADKFQPSIYMRWEQSAPCCPVLLKDVLELASEADTHFEDYVKWSIVIDAAAYESPQQATDIGNPYILLSKIISLAPADVQAKIVELIAWRPARDVLTAAPEIESASWSVRRQEQEIHVQLNKLVVFDGAIALFDQSQYDWPYQRYHPYLIHPDARFVIGIYKIKRGFTISLGANPWMPKPSFHIGRLCEAFGGGGHAQVGGVTVEARSEAQSLASEIRRAVQQKLVHEMKR